MNTVGWFEIYVDDLDRAKRFYESVLNISLESMADMSDLETEMLAFPSDMNSYGIAGALVKMEGVAAGGNSTLVYFMCEDCATEASRVEAAGGSIMREKFAIGEHGFVALAYDSEKNLFGLHSMQ